jgi:hypothetical protein
MRFRTSLALPAFLALAIANAQPAVADPSVTQIVNQSGTALHVAAMRKVHIIHFNAKATQAGIAGTAEGWAEIGGSRITQMYSNPPLSGGNGWDGKNSWSLDQTGLAWIDGSDAGRASTITTAYITNYDLWKPHYGGANVAWSGSKDEKDRTYDVLTITAPGSGLPFDLWIDRATHLPKKAIQNIGPIVSTTELSDFRSVGGILMPYVQKNATSDGNSSLTEITHVDVNPQNGAAHLAKPRSTVHDFSIANGAQQTIVPMQLAENHVYLSVMLNGKGPYRFIFDTGGQNVVDPAVAKEIGASGKGSAQGGGVGSTTETSSFALVDSLQVGDATVQNQVFSIAPIRQGFGVSAGQQVDGLIGFEVLSRFITTFDYANNRVVLQLPGAYTAPAGAHVVPIVQNGEQPQFACEIDSVPAECTLDTGARDSLSFYGPFLKAHPQLVPSTLTAVGVNGFGFGGAALGKLGRTQTLSFGSFTLHNMIGDYTTQTAGAFASPFVGANIGGAVWKRFALTLDYNKLTMTLTPNANFDSPDSNDRSGLFLINHAGNVTIADARPGTPAAAAGLAKGDALVSIDGVATSTLSLQAIREKLLGAPGTVLHLTVKAKDGTSRDVTLTLADYV